MNLDAQKHNDVRHLKVLEDAGLVTSEKHGRVRTVSLRPGALWANTGVAMMVERMAIALRVLRLVIGFLHTMRQANPRSVRTFRNRH